MTDDKDTVEEQIMHNKQSQLHQQPQLHRLLRRKAAVVRILCRVSLAFSQCAREAGVHTPLTATAAALSHHRPTTVKFYSESEGYLEFDVADYRFKTEDEYRWPRYAMGPVLKLPKHREPADVDCIQALMRQLRFYRRLPEEVQRKVAAQAYYMKLDKGRDVLRVGHIGYSFYIIFSGQVSIRTAGATSAEPVRLRKGDSFGERALLFETVRNATVTTETPLAEFLIVYDDCFFESGLAGFLAAQYLRIESFLRRMPLFASVQQRGTADSVESSDHGESQSILTSLSRSCALLEYLDGWQIVADSRQSDCVWFLMSGSADHCRLAAPACLARIGHLTVGKSFGLASLFDSNRSFSLVSRGCQVLVVAKATLLSHLSMEDLHSAHLRMECSPSDKRMLRNCQRQSDWLRYRRQEVLSTVHRMKRASDRFDKLHSIQSASSLSVSLPSIVKQPTTLSNRGRTQMKSLTSNSTLAAPHLEFNAQKGATADRVVIQRSFTTFEQLNRIS